MTLDEQTLTSLFLASHVLGLFLGTLAAVRVYRAGSGVGLIDEIVSARSIGRAIEVVKRHRDAPVD